MVTKQTILKHLPAYKGIEKTLIDNQSTIDIIKGIIDTHKKYAGDYDNIYHYFLGSTIKETCNNIFQFLKSNVPYEIEKGKKQMLRSPASILEHSKGADCKSYALFTNGVLDAFRRNENVNFDIVYRFAGYGENKDLEHVYSVVSSKYGEFWNDPVLNYFDSREITPNFILDKKIKPMALISVNGVFPQNKQPLNYQQRTILEQLKPQPFYVYYGVANKNTAIGNIDISNASDVLTNILSGNWGGLFDTIKNIFHYVSDGEKRKTAFDASGLTVDQIAQYYLNNYNNFGAKSEWQLNEFSELYSNKAPQQGHGWANRNSELTLATAKRFNDIVNKRTPNSDWDPLVINLNEVGKNVPGGGSNTGTGTPTGGGQVAPQNKSILLPIGLGILAIKMLM